MRYLKGREITTTLQITLQSQQLPRFRLCFVQVEISRSSSHWTAAKQLAWIENAHWLLHSCLAASA